MAYWIAYWIAYSIAYWIFYWIAHYIAYWIATHWFRFVKYSHTEPTVKPYISAQTSLTRFGQISIDFWFKVLLYKPTVLW